MKTGNGAYCSTAQAIVPIYGDDPCDWCAKRHGIEYRWNGKKWRRAQRTVYLFEGSDGVQHAVRPLANFTVCGTKLGATGEVVSVVFAEDVPLATTCPDCIKTLDEEER